MEKAKIKDVLSEQELNRLEKKTSINPSSNVDQLRIRDLADIAFCMDIEGPFFSDTLIELAERSKCKGKAILGNS